MHPTTSSANAHSHGQKRSAESHANKNSRYAVASMSTVPSDQEIRNASSDARAISACVGGGRTANFSRSAGGRMGSNSIADLLSEAALRTGFVAPELLLC
jgi:hypothetical protein